MSVSARECLGMSRCPFGTDCFAERARAESGQADVVVTNHALLAIDAISGIQVLPEHDVVVIDEAHELVDRVTSVATAELSTAAISVAAKRCAKLIDEQEVDRWPRPRPGSSCSRSCRPAVGPPARRCGTGWR